MAVADGDVDHRGCVGQRLAVFQTAADEQVIGLGGEAHDDADVVGVGTEREPAAGRFVFFLSLPEGLDPRDTQVTCPALDDVVLVGAAASGAPGGRVAGAA